MCCGFIVKMPDAACHSALEPRRIRSAFEQLAFVIAFEYQRLATAQAGFDMRRRTASIGQYTKPVVAVANDELHRFARIVRYGERFDFQGADRNVHTAAQNPHFDAFERLRTEHTQRTVRKPDRNLQLSRKPRNAIGMIGMFMRDDNRTQRFKLTLQPREPLAQFSKRETAVDQKARGARLDE